MSETRTRSRPKYILAKCECFSPSSRWCAYLFISFFFLFKKKLFNHFPLLSLAYHSAPGLILDVCLLATHRQMRICADKREANKHKTTSAIWGHFLFNVIYKQLLSLALFDNHIQNIWVAQRKRVKEKSLEIELCVCVCVGSSKERSREGGEGKENRQTDKERERMQVLEGWGEGEGREKRGWIGKLEER